MSAVPKEVAPTTRLALTPTEAADVLGVSRSTFYEHIFDSVRVVRVGRKVLVPVRELERWLERNSALTLERR